MTELGPVASVSLAFPVTDESIQSLTKVAGLKELRLPKSELSEPGLQQLREALPNTNVTVSKP